MRDEIAIMITVTVAAVALTILFIIASGCQDKRNQRVIECSSTANVEKCLEAIR